MKRGIAISMIVAELLAGATPALAQETMGGLWLNPRATVAVRTGDCGGKLCGWIAWASAPARADAREAGIDRLEGLALLENYVPSGTGERGQEDLESENAGVSAVGRPG